MSGLAWKLQRLRAMGARELVYRLRRAGRMRLERHGALRAPCPAPHGEAGRPWLTALPHGFDTPIYEDSARRVLAGRFDVFALSDAALGFPPPWNRDPKTGTTAPLAFGKTLNYRDERVVGDIKYLWEPNRHAELVTLAQAWHLTRDQKYANGCRALLDSWFRQCPYPLGPNWTSSLEHGVRLANWAVAWALLGEDGLGDADFKRRWLESVYRHCHFIAGHLSRHSSANNHLLGELMGLLIGATVWPLWPESVSWREQTLRAFETQALAQNGEDGVNREQAVWYQHEVADMMLLAGLKLRANGIEFGAAYWQRLERMLEFIAALMDAGGNVPAVGDADDARLVRLDPRPTADVFRSLLATGAVLFGRADFKAKAGGFDDKTRWLLGDAAAHSFDAIVAAPLAEPRRDFPAGGYAVLGTCFGRADEIRLVADGGPLGYLSIAAHGHADALAFTLSAGGREMLVDPGTYAYHTQRQWRDYFKGTGAHNTVRVDGLDQSVSGGNFLWTRHAAARRDRFTSSVHDDSWVASHDGYRRLRDPVTHHRSIVLDKRKALLRVTDRLECAGVHRVELLFHAGQACRVDNAGGAVRVVNGPTMLTLRNTAPGLRLDLVRGRVDPPLGWVSPRFDEKVPTTTIVWSGEIDGSTEWTTEIAIGFDDTAVAAQMAARPV